MRRSPAAGFDEAVLRGQPDDKGLYFPDRIPPLPADFLDTLPGKSEEAIAFEVIRPYVAGSIPDEFLYRICSETVNFPFPLVEVSPGIHALELFHGPTLAFKDVGARFMSRCLRHFSHQKGEKTIVIVATSGDTGGAVAAGFHGVDGVEVVILYPRGKVSRVQELQLTALGGNVTALEVAGNFDDCQALAKQALADAELKKRVFLTSANSINVARWLPQQFYYFFALKHWHGEPPVFSIPSGNFGNIAAGLLAWRSGLPAAFFIAACNANDAVPEFFKTGSFEPKSAKPTLSNAMDVGNPSNWVRVLELFDNDPGRMKQHLIAVSVSDVHTRETMLRVRDESGYTLDPHGAVAYRALVDHLAERPDQNGIFLETAHPIKFDSVIEILGSQGSVPESVRTLESRRKSTIEIDPDHDAVKEILLSKI